MNYSATDLSSYGDGDLKQPDWGYIDWVAANVDGYANVIDITKTIDLSNYDCDAAESRPLDDKYFDWISQAVCDDPHGIAAAVCPETFEQLRADEFEPLASHDRVMACAAMGRRMRKISALRSWNYARLTDLEAVVLALFSQDTSSLTPEQLDILALIASDSLPWRVDGRIVVPWLAARRQSSTYQQRRACRERRDRQPIRDRQARAVGRVMQPRAPGFGSAQHTTRTNPRGSP